MWSIKAELMLSSIDLRSFTVSIGNVTLADLRETGRATAESRDDSKVGWTDLAYTDFVDVELLDCCYDYS